MNNAEQFQFKLELVLNLKSAENIQKWATNRIDQDITDSEALEICFFSKEKQVLDYFFNIPFEWLNLDPTLKKKIFREVLKRYIELPATIEFSKELISNVFGILLEFTRIADDEDLYDFINHYDDEFYLSLEGISELEPEEIWSTFLNDLKNLLSTKLTFI